MGDQQLPDQLVTITSGLSLASVAAAFGALWRAGRGYQKIEGDHAALKDRVTACESTHRHAGEKLDAMATSTAKMSGVLEQVVESVNAVHRRLDDVVRK